MYAKLVQWPTLSSVALVTVAGVAVNDINNHVQMMFFPVIMHHDLIALKYNLCLLPSMPFAYS